MKEINFSHNWNNKLNCDIYTTIRRLTVEKYCYYERLEGEIFDVILKGKKIHQAKLIYVVRILARSDSLIYPLFAFDTGMERNEAMELFKKFKVDVNDFILLVFKKLIK